MTKPIHSQSENVVVVNLHDDWFGFALMWREVCVTALTFLLDEFGSFN